MCGFYLGGPAWAGMGIRYCAQCEPRPHRVVMTYVGRGGSFFVQFLAEDAQTVISKRYRLPDREALRGMVLRTRPTADALERFDRALAMWGQGSQALCLSAAQYRALVQRR